MSEGEIRGHSEAKSHVHRESIHCSWKALTVELLFSPGASNTFVAIQPPFSSFPQSGLTGLGDDGWLSKQRCAGLTIAGDLELPDDLLGLLVGDLAKDDMLAIKPAGLDGGDEELRSVSRV